ncbi:MAG: glycosyltransferase family 2 protein [Blautia sp.]
MCENSNMIVSICIVAYNEEKSLPGLFQDILKQTYPHDNIEVVLIDSGSTDSTKNMMIKFKEEHQEFWAVQVLDNPKGIQASGWNVAIKSYRGDVITRIDAHSSITPNFVEENVKLQKEGEFVTGGPRPCVIDEDTDWKRTLLLAEESMFGSSIAKYRRNGEKVYVNSLFHGTYRREVFEKVGGFNEQLGRTEDNEIHYRIRKAGYKICFSPNIVSFQHARNSLKKMLKQKYGNGYWVALTLKACPKCLSIYHFVPLCFVSGIILTTILSIVGFPILAYLMWAAYWLMAVLMSCLSIKGNKKNKYMWLLPALFFLLHVSYGIGSLVGIVKMPFWKYENKE